ncbi:testis-specific serine/threonine-protein kinase 6 [Ranitomeya variabilis]|uniref:testis-specific serine/threonine-protein kinase 6 n=1 Tax=Ranitomeya variabilis TaxID=490064 RepID=UPI004056F086
MVGWSLSGIMPTADHLLKQLGYDTLGTFGEGAYSNVKMATSRNHQRKVAIKVIDKKKVSAENARKLLPHELAILRKVKHPTVITAFEFEISNYPQFIVMELCVSDLMQFVLNAVRLSAEMARHLFRQIARGLRYLHKHHMAHRDLKCENVLITSDINAKISDLSFGIMFDGNSSSLCTTYCGCPQYASPEVLHCIPYDPRKTDIWSLGVILYIMVTGEMPFNRTYLNTLLKIQQKEEVRFPVDIKVEEKCKSLIKEMLQYNPGDRPDIHTVTKQDWLQAAQNI